MKTGTTTVGLVCKDGIVLAADKRATSGNLIVTKYVDKILEVYNGMAVTTAGTVSDIQLMTKLIKAELSLKAVRTDTTPNVKEAANLLAGLREYCHADQGTSYVGGDGSADQSQV